MGGKQIDPCTQESHAHKDKACLVEVANNVAKDAIENQLEMIRLHLASSTLTDNISSSPSTTVPGGSVRGHILCPMMRSTKPTTVKEEKEIQRTRLMKI